MRLIAIPNRFDSFVKEYRLPLWSTVSFIVILILLLLLRTYERNVLAGILGDNSSKDRDYANLINTDKDAELKKGQVDSENPSKEADPSSTNTSTQTTALTIDSGGTVSPPPPSPTSPPPPPPPSPAPFNVQLSGFGLKSQSGPMPCSTNSPDTPSSCKQYELVAGIKTFNGPGTVHYSLRWFGPMSGEWLDSFGAGPGDTFIQINRYVMLHCDKPGPYTFRFVIMQPNFVESPDVPVNHSCTSSGG